MGAGDLGNDGEAKPAAPADTGGGEALQQLRAPMPGNARPVILDRERRAAAGSRIQRHDDPGAGRAVIAGISQ